MSPLVLLVLLACLLSFTVSMTFVRKLVQGASVEPMDEFTYPTGAKSTKTFDAPDAQTVVQELVTAGFNPIGAVRLQSFGQQIESSVLLGPDQQTYAVVAPGKVKLISDYNGKSLSSRTNVDGVSASFELAHVFHKSTTAELLSQHQASIEHILTVTGNLARRLDPAEVVGLEVNASSYQNSNYSLGGILRAAFKDSSHKSARHKASGRHADETIQEWIKSPHTYAVA